MTDYIDVAIAVIQTAATATLDADDKHLAGVYCVHVPKGLSERSAASTALDVFHSVCAVAVLDDFVFFVFDPRTRKVLDENDEHESYSSAHLGGGLNHASDKSPGIYTITLEAVGDDGDVALLGNVTVVGNNESEARQSVFSLLWDARLDTSGCAPRYRVETVHSPCANQGEGRTMDIQQRYLDQGGNKCPSCQSEATEGGSIEIDNNIATQEVRCLECEATWNDQYKLIGFDNLVIE